MSRIEEMLASGELQRAAQGCSTWAQVAQRLGMTPKALERQRERAKAAGRIVPSLAELQNVRVENCTFEGGVVAGANDFDEEEATQPGLPPLPAIGPGFRVRHKSTCFDAEGNVTQQWLKVSAENDERQDWLEAIRDATEPLPPIESVCSAPMLDDDLLTTYPVGDPHIGLLAWHEDAGENFDMDIAERNLVAAFNHLVAIAPPSRDALLIYIGDNAHADSQSNQTTKGTRVDADGRTVKMARRIIRTIRRNIETVLTKHERARVIVERGNHDELISAMIALGLALLYENEPRVSVDQSPEMYHWWRFGSVLIGTHHGDKAKPMDLLGVMAVDRQQDWGETKHRRFYCGHLHHQITKEVPGIVLHYLPTLASSDAWHRAMGYRSQRAMYMDVFHKEHGHVNRHFVGVDQLRAA